MCPDRQIISLYFDGELPSPWKEKMETHLESCTNCRTSLAGYQNLRLMIRVQPEEIVRTAQDRVWEKLGAGELITSRPPNEKAVSRDFRTGRRVWNRTISLPLPAAAAAALVIIVVFFALMGIRGGGIQSQPQNSMAVANIGLDDQDIVPAKDMSGVLKYLSSQENNDVMVIRLPETRNFSRTGEPALINAADYSRRITPR